MADAAKKPVAKKACVLKKKAKCEKAKLTKVKVGKVNLAGATITGARFTVTNRDLTGARLTDVRFEKVKTSGGQTAMGRENACVTVPEGDLRDLLDPAHFGAHSPTPRGFTCSGGGINGTNGVFQRTLFYGETFDPAAFDLVATNVALQLVR